MQRSHAASRLMSRNVKVKGHPQVATEKATALSIEALHFPNEEIRQRALAGDWPELQPHQWAILTGHPKPFMSWYANVMPREEYEKAKAETNGKQP